MLEKLITNLKNSLPELLRKKLGGGEETEDNSEGSDESEVQNKGNVESSAEDKKKNSMSMLIRVVVIIALGYLALDEFVLKKSDTGTEQSSEAAVSAKIKARAAKRKAEAMAAAKAAQAGGEVTTTETVSSTAQVPEAPQDPTPPIENVNILDKNETPVESQSVAETPTTEASAEVISSKVVDTSVDHKLDQLVENVEQSTPTASTTEEVKIPSQSEISERVVPKKDNSMASKIVEDVIETPPPSYDHVGRGLVYNCKDKYWACVDKAAYVTCNKNMKWNKSKGSSMECVVQNIYNTDEDCAKIQKYNVSTIQSTAFCQ